MRRFQLHLASSGAGTPNINATVSALRFFFKVTLDRPDLAERLAFVHEPRKLPVVLSPEEVARLLEAAPGLKYKAALSVAYGAGLRVSEVVALKVGDIDSERMMLRVEQGKGRKDRYVMLSPQLLELLRDWWTASRGRRAGCFPAATRSSPMSTRQLNRACPRRGPGRRDHQARVAAHAAAQLCHPSARAGHRYPRHPGAARSRDILPANTRSRGGFTIRSIPGAARPCSLSGNTPTVVLSWSSFRSPTGRSPAYPRG